MRIVLIMMLGVVVTACGTTSTNSKTPQLNMANPASQYCEKIGGESRLSNNVGYCHFPDGTFMNEWELFRKDHPEGELK
ncbi:putative hemolysin [Ignatzschineria sp. LJL83]